MSTETDAMRERYGHLIGQTLQFGGDLGEGRLDYFMVRARRGAVAVVHFNGPHIYGHLEVSPSVIGEAAAR